MSYKTEISVKLSCDNCGRDLKNNEECLVLYEYLDEDYVFCGRDCYEKFIAHNICLTNYYNITQEIPILQFHKADIRCTTCGKDLTTDDYLTIYILNHDNQFRYFCSEKCLHKYWLSDDVTSTESVGELIDNEKDNYNLEYDW